jgi:hypothetical protein
MSNQEQLISVALQQRIGELVSEYERRMAELRAAYTVNMTELQGQVRDLTEKLEAKDEPTEKTAEK